MKGSSPRFILITAAGWLMFGLGLAGVFVPGLPTTIFWILAALAFLRVNRRMYQRIITHRRFGEAVRLFVEEGRISRRGKVISMCAMLLGAGTSIIFIPALWVKLLVAAGALGGSIWVAVLPTTAEDTGSTPGPAQGPAQAGEPKTGRGRRSPHGHV